MVEIKMFAHRVLPLSAIQSQFPFLIHEPLIGPIYDPNYMIYAIVKQ